VLCLSLSLSLSLSLNLGLGVCFLLFPLVVGKGWVVRVLLVVLELLLLLEVMLLLQTWRCETRSCDRSVLRGRSGYSHVSR
jgi:hypothetical protein